MKTLFIYNTIACAVFGTGLVLFPTLTLSIVGVSTEPGGLFIAKLFGSALIFVALLCWFARNAEPSTARRAIVSASFFESILGCIIALTVQLSGLLNILGWLIVGTYFSLAVGYGYFYFKSASSR